MKCHAHISALRAAVAVVAALLLLSGCKSHKNSGTTAGRPDRYTSTDNRPPADYSYEQTDAVGASLVAEARRWLGTPYQYGAHTKGVGTDCSGLVMEVYGAVTGVALPRSTSTQFDFCTNLKRRLARPGDLVFFGNTSKGGAGVTHVGLYIGQGQMIHASSSRGVMVSDIDTGYWGDRFCAVGRVEGVIRTNNKSAPRSKKSQNTPPSDPIYDQPSTPIPSRPSDPIYDQPDASLPSAPSPLVPSPAKPQPPATPSPTSGQQSSGNCVAGVTSSTVPHNPTATPNTTPDTIPNTLPGTTPETSHDPHRSIDILDQLINQALDSIYSAPFMD